ncbi:MAG: hypothetical protein AAGC69_23725 [Paracraurococcus sp.]|jgi:hypothetical protein
MKLYRFLRLLGAVALLAAALMALLWLPSPTIPEWLRIAALAVPALLLLLLSRALRRAQKTPG